MRALCIMALVAMALIASTRPIWPQGNPFAAAVRINDRFITQYELDQRKLLYEFLNASGNLEELALQRLIDERLQLGAAEQLEVSVSDEQVANGMKEFAERVNLTAEQFISEIKRAGIDPETFEDFVRAGIVWRRVVRGLFGPEAQVTDAEVERTLELSSNASGVRILISEIFLRADTPDRLAIARQQAQEISEITTFPAFAAAARRHSAAPSRERGGLQDWDFHHQSAARYPHPSPNAGTRRGNRSDHGA